MNVIIQQKEACSFKKIALIYTRDEKVSIMFANHKAWFFAICISS